MIIFSVAGGIDRTSGLVARINVQAQCYKGFGRLSSARSGVVRHSPALIIISDVSQVDTLSEAQKVEVGEVLAGRPAGEASVAAVELGVGEDRTCPHCGAHGAVANGKSRGMQRYLCRSCNRTFGAVTGTPLSGLHRKDLWLTFSECLANGDTVAVSAKRCGIAGSTAFRWRHRFLAGIKSTAEKLKGIVEADETYFRNCPATQHFVDRLDLVSLL